MPIRLIFIILVTGCSLIETVEEEKTLTPVRKQVLSDSILQFSLDLKEYKSILEVDSTVSRARLIPIFNRESSANSVEQYRIFDIQPGSLYEYIGLKNLDEIVAIDGYYLPGSTAFFRYLSYMAQYRRGQIEIRRKGRPLVIRYKIR